MPTEVPLRLTFNATGGVPPYDGTGPFTREAGLYLYVVTDANGCIRIPIGYIPQPDQLVAAATAPAIPCNGTSTTVTVTANGGTAPDTGTGTFTRGPGNWSFTITDANNCTTNASINIATLSCGPFDVNKCYKIVNRNGGRALSADDNKAKQGKQVQVKNWSQSNEQIWKLKQATGISGFYRIINQASTKLSLEAENGTTAQDGKVILDPYTNANFQKWKMTATGDYYFITPQHYTISPNNRLVVKGANPGNNKEVVINGKNIPTGSTSEQWAITEVGCPANALRGGAVPIVQEAVTPEEETVAFKDFSVTVNPNPVSVSLMWRLQVRTM